MTPETYYGRPLTFRPGPEGTLKGIKVYCDFDRDAYYGRRQRQFKGMSVVATHIRNTVGDGDWSNVVPILTRDASVAIKHEEKEGTHFFVFNADRIQGEGGRSLYQRVVGGVVIEDGGLLDAFEKVKAVPAAFLQFLADDAAVRLFGSASAGDAKKWLPMTIRMLAASLSDEMDGNEDELLGDLQVDAAVVARAMSILLARVQNRDDVSAVLRVLDGLEEERRAYFASNPEVVRLVAQNDITTADIEGWAYRRGQLSIFKKMLDAKEQVVLYKDEHGITSDGEEGAWQHFFERNRWIFGLALDFFFNEGVDKEKLEQIVVGANLLSVGKRPDAVMASAGLIRNLCFVEIKTPRKHLIGELYRGEVWSPGTELSGGVAQVQKTVHKALRVFQESFKMENDEGAEYGGLIFSIQPRAVLVVGSLTEFRTEAGAIRKHVYSSFELYRKSLWMPEVVTFDELYERSRALVAGHIDLD